METPPEGNQHDGHNTTEASATEFIQVQLHSFFYKNLFYKNVEGEIYQNFKNMLRTYPRLRVRKRLYFAHLG